MKNLISILIIISAMILTSCQNDTASQNAKLDATTSEVASTPEKEKELNISINNGTENETAKAAEVLKNNPLSTDNNSKVIDVNAMPQPQVKSVGSAKQVKTNSNSKSDIYITDNTTNEPIKTEREEVKIEMTQPKVIGGRAKGTPAPAVKKELSIDTKSTSSPKVKVEEVKTSSPKIEPKVEEAPRPPAFTHEAWDRLLQSNVSASGKVNYKGFKANQSAFDAYLKALADNPIQSNWSRNKKMAYWINAYNAFTIKLILDNYPVSKITDLHGGKPWDKKWIKLGDKTYSLNNIENDILRPQYKEPAIHFAVNCAAKSCPPILNRAWTADNLNSNFAKQAKAFINDSSYNNISADKVELSKIFEWYGSDFGDLITYLNKYANTKINPNAKVGYMEYNWNLNE